MQGQVEVEVVLRPLDTLTLPILAPVDQAAITGGVMVITTEEVQALSFLEALLITTTQHIPRLSLIPVKDQYFHLYAACVAALQCSA